MKRIASYRRLALLAALMPLLLSVGLPPGLVLCVARDHIAVEASHEGAHSSSGSCAGALRTLPPSLSAADQCTDIGVSVVADSFLEATKHVSPAPTVVGVLYVSAPVPALGPEGSQRFDGSPLLDSVQRTLRAVRLLV